MEEERKMTDNTNQQTNSNSTPVTTDGYSNLLNILTQEKNSISKLSEKDLRILQETIAST